jgi:hypothetical protein
LGRGWEGLGVKVWGGGVRGLKVLKMLKVLKVLKVLLLLLVVVVVLLSSSFSKDAGGDIKFYFSRL